MMFITIKRTNKLYGTRIIPGSRHFEILSIISVQFLIEDNIIICIILIFSKKKKKKWQIN